MNTPAPPKKSKKRGDEEGGEEAMTQDEINKQEWERRANWTSRWGMYRSESDPRLWVPKRNPAMGWTLNMAHQKARLTLVAMVIVPPALFFLLLYLRHRLL